MNALKLYCRRILSVPRRSCWRDGSAGQLVPKPGNSRPHRQHRRRPLDYKEDSELQELRAKSYFRFCRTYISQGCRIIMGSSKSVITALETVLKQRDIRIANRTLKNFVKEIDRVAPWYPGQFRITDPCLMEQTSSDDSESSKDEVLDTDEEAKLDEEAARYEEERYHPDDHIQNSKEPRKRQLQTAFSQVVPSAPPPYETCPKSYSFIPEKGLGYRSHPTISSSTLTWKSMEGYQGQFAPYVLPLPVNLWGRDIMQ
ncbi:Peptidase A2A, retrovirus, catalytic containing protein, partial [Cricetulus griseus]